MDSLLLYEYIKDEHIPKIEKYCRGCSCFNPKEQIINICTIMQMYEYVILKQITMKKFLGYIKNCPCNFPCLVKVTCGVTTCEKWAEYYDKEVKTERLNQNQIRYINSRCENNEKIK